MRYRLGLNEQDSLAERLRSALRHASTLDFAVAYAKTAGVAELTPFLPCQTRAVIGLGFGLSDPEAVERLADAGVDVRVVLDSQNPSVKSERIA